MVEILFIELFKIVLVKLINVSNTRKIYFLMENMKKSE